jgi:hypothetical protein
MDMIHCSHVNGELRQYFYMISHLLQNVAFEFLALLSVWKILSYKRCGDYLF